MVGTGTVDVAAAVTPRLVRRRLTVDGRRVAVAVGGRGLPLVLAGHSLGGRLVTELAATQPERVVALLLVDAGVGGPWDSLVRLIGYAPASVGVLGTMLLADALGTVPLARDLDQAACARAARDAGLGPVPVPAPRRRPHYTWTRSRVP